MAPRFCNSSPCTTYLVGKRASKLHTYCMTIQACDDVQGARPCSQKSANRAVRRHGSQNSAAMEQPS